MLRTVLSLLLLCLTTWAHAAGDELLEPEQAFKFSADWSGPDEAAARFKLAPGYHLYKDKLRFSVVGGKLGDVDLPAGKTKTDEYFGKVEVYTQDFHVALPIRGTDKPVTLKAYFQGCSSELGVCYPPQESVVELPAPASAARQFAAFGGGMAGSGGGSGLRSLSGQAGEDPAFLPPEEAFKIEAVLLGTGEVSVHFSPAAHHYLYRDKIKLTLESPKGATLTAPTLPESEVKDDPNFGKMHIYHQAFEAKARVEGLSAGPANIKLRVEYQGCSEQGICYPPMDQVFDLSAELSSGAAAGASLPASAAANSASTPPEDTSESGKIAAMLKGGSFWLVVVTFFGFGLLLALTPCVFPMIPILSGIIVGQGQGITKSKGFMLSLAYVLGMAITYALAGVAAGMSGTLISNALQNAWALGTGAAIFIALAFSMFGFYELQLPSFLQSRFTEASNRMKGGNFIGVFLMGAISALIVGPCVAAPLAGALLYIGQTGDLVLGGVSLFFLALGMGIPLLLIGLSAGALLPRAGAWMEAVKKFFGVLMLAVAIWLISPLISEVLYMLLWASLLVISGMHLRALEPLAVNASGWMRLWKGVGLLAVVTGIALLLGALGGSRDVLQPLAIFKPGVASAGAGPVAHLEFKRVKTVAELEQAVAAARGKPVMLDFYADWCVSCKEMERFTFADPRVQTRLKDVVLLQADVTGNTPDDKALLKRFTLFGPPGMIFFDANGVQQGFRVVGYEPPAQFLESLNKALP